MFRHELKIVIHGKEWRMLLLGAKLLDSRKSILMPGFCSISGPIILRIKGRELA